MIKKITIAVLVVLAIALVVPTADALQYEGIYDKWCKLQLNNDKITWRDGLCRVDIFQMFRNIESLDNKVSDLQVDMIDTQKALNSATNAIQDNQQKIKDVVALPSDIDTRLQILEGKIHAPYVDLTVHVHPEKISTGEKFVISGSADRMEQYWVDFEFYNPDGESIQNEWVNIQPDNIYFSDVLVSNSKWNVSGNYTVVVTHDLHSEKVIIPYISESP